jgi:hypothetical protein
MQGRVKMDLVIVGIDVSKDRLDVHVLPSGEAFAQRPYRSTATHS